MVSVKARLSFSLKSTSISNEKSFKLSLGLWSAEKIVTLSEISFFIFKRMYQWILESGKSLFFLFSFRLSVEYRAIVKGLSTLKQKKKIKKTKGVLKAKLNQSAKQG